MYSFFRRLLSDNCVLCVSIIIVMICIWQLLFDIFDVFFKFVICKANIAFDFIWPFGHRSHKKYQTSLYHGRVFRSQYFELYNTLQLCFSHKKIVLKMGIMYFPIEKLKIYRKMLKKGLISFVKKKSGQSNQIFESVTIHYMLWRKKGDGEK